MLYVPKSWFNSRGNPKFIVQQRQDRSKVILFGLKILGYVGFFNVKNEGQLDPYIYILEEIT